jgi:hypothetical protein
MLAMFSPLDYGSFVVTAPVSLIDIAPTVRKVIGFADAATDGRVLPRTDAKADPQRVARTMTVQSLGVIDSVGIRRNSMSADELSRLGHLQPDGSFGYSPEVIDRFRRLYH